MVEIDGISDGLSVGSKDGLIVGATDGTFDGYSHLFENSSQTSFLYIPSHVLLE